MGYGGDAAPRLSDPVYDKFPGSRIRTSIPYCAVLHPSSPRQSFGSSFYRTSRWNGANLAYLLESYTPLSTTLHHYLLESMQVHPGIAQ